MFKLKALHFFKTNLLSCSNFTYKNSAFVAQGLDIQVSVFCSFFLVQGSRICRFLVPISSFCWFSSYGLQSLQASGSSFLSLMCLVPGSGVCRFIVPGSRVSRILFFLVSGASLQVSGYGFLIFRYLILRFWVSENSGLILRFWVSDIQV